MALMRDSGCWNRGMRVHISLLSRYKRVFVRCPFLYITDKTSVDTSCVMSLRLRRQAAIMKREGATGIPAGEEFMLCGYLKKKTKNIFCK